MADDDAYVTANYEHFKATANFVVGTAKSSMQIALAYRDGRLVFMRGNTEASVPASGRWEGIAYFYDNGLVRKLDHVKIVENTIVIRINAGRLVVGEWVVPCKWDAMLATKEEIDIDTKRKSDRSVWELKLVGQKKILPSVEVDVAHDNAVFFACETVIAAILGTLAKSKPVTVYVYETPSINFGRPTNSIYFVVGGPERVVSLLHSALRTVPGADVRFGEMIAAKNCVPRLHWEEGVVWVPHDGDEWRSVGSA